MDIQERGCRKDYRNLEAVYGKYISVALLLFTLVGVGCAGGYLYFDKDETGDDLSCLNAGKNLDEYGNLEIAQYAGALVFSWGKDDISIGVQSDGIGLTDEYPFIKEKTDPAKAKAMNYFLDDLNIKKDYRRNPYKINIKSDKVELDIKIDTQTNSTTCVEKSLK